MTGEIPPIRWTGIGSWPGTDMTEALKVSFDECPELPFVPELPDRGVPAQLVGRGTAFLADLAVDLQPAGWRLADAPGADARRARALLRDDLDRLEEAAQGYLGPVKLGVVGPWTLAGSVERPRGDRALGDSGARRDLAQSLTQGLADVLAELARRLPDVAWVLQLDEPLLPAVRSGALTRASGLGRHDPVEDAELSGSYTDLVAAVAPVPVAVHSCAAGMPIGLLPEAGVAGLALDLDQLTSSDWDALAVAMEAGCWLGAGALATAGLAAGPPVEVPSADAVATRVLRPLRTLGLEPAVAARTVLTPACGLAGATPAAAVAALRALRVAAGILTDELPR